MRPLQTKPYMLEVDPEHAFQALGLRLSVKANTGQTGGSFSLIEFTGPPGFVTPMHIHYAEDVAVFVVEGSMTVFWGDEEREAAPGSFFYQPRGTPHGFRVRDDAPARVLYLTIPAGFDQLIQEPGLSAHETHCIDLAARYQIEILGPLPDQTESPAQGGHVGGEG